MSYKVEWGTSPFADKAKYKGGMSLTSNKRKRVAYYVKDTPTRALKRYHCACCKRIIEVEEIYYFRVKEHYMDRPRYFEDFRLCKTCGENT